MKYFLLLLLAVPAFSRTLSVDDLKSRFMVSGEIFIFDATGKKLISQGTEWRTWHNRNRSGKIESNWSSETDRYPLVALRHEWQVRDDGSIVAKIEQFGELKERGKDEGPEFRKSLRKEEIVVENFATVNWVAHQTPEYRTVVRLTPTLRPETPVKAVTDFPISGTNLIVTDSKGNLWASRVSLDAKYGGIVTHRGSVFLSFFPFPGAKELGTANGRTIELNPEGDFFINIVGHEAFLPEGIQAKVYGKVDLKRRTERLTSVRMMTSNKEEEFLKKIGG